MQTLAATAQAMVAKGKGILAIDESLPTIKQRFADIGVESTEQTRRDYRDLLITTPGSEAYLSGVILFDETIRQSTTDGLAFPEVMLRAGIMPGIKVDAGAKALAGHPGEKITEGLDGLRERLAEYKTLGAKFAKWRAVITVGEGLPSPGCIEANVHGLARYAALCQEADIVPMVEPEVLMDGEHTIERCLAVTEATLKALFHQLYKQKVALQHTILKVNMVVPGQECAEQASDAEVAEATVTCLLNTVPAAVAGIAFLSGGQSAETATRHLNMMNKTYHRLPWPLSFSYGRALQAPCLAAWQGKSGNIAAAQAALLHREKCNSQACLGEYVAD